MKKRVLFIISSLDSGGVSKSLVNLLNIIDSSKYNISLFICNPSGLYLPLIPNEINLITDYRISALLSKYNGFKILLRRKDFLLAFGHLLRLIVSCFSKARAGQLLSKLMPAISGNWDVIVDYNGQHQLYYMIDKLKGNKKYTFFHSDYSKWHYYYSIDKRYFKHVDGIFTISNHCVNELKKWFPDEKNKIRLIENITSVELINKLAILPVADLDVSKPCFVTIGHICKSKGSDIALKSAGILKQRGYDFNWYFIGSNSNDLDYNNIIINNNVTENIHFIGLRQNPYPYMNKASLIVHPSLFEGKSIALDEAKILCKPIVVTNFTTVYDQFQDHLNATICEMNADSLANAIEELIKDKSLQRKYIDYLQYHKSDNSNEINKFYKLFDF